DVLSFLMKKENMPFPEALRGLAERCGRSLPVEAAVVEDPARQKEKKQIFEINRIARGFFLEACARSESAQAYLKGRGVSETTAHVFNLGYAPDAWDGLYSHLKRQGFRDGEMERAGLVLPKTKGNGYYDRFRNRIIFPIVDIQERVIGFGGRVMDDGVPKYLNSPETLVFDKGANLYGLHLASEAIRKQDYALLVEGYMDVITAYQIGIRNVVATLGTALTQRHLKRLRRYTRNLALFFDSDDAGFKAAERCFDLCVPERVKVKVVTLDRGEDPDSFLKKAGRPGFSIKMAEARPIMDFMIHQVVGDEAPATLEGKVEATARLQPMLAAITDPIEQELYIKEVASRMGLEPATLKQTVLTSRRKGWTKDRTKEERREQASSIPAMEGRFLGLLLSYPQVIPKIRDKIATEDFTHSGLKAAVSRLLALPEEALEQHTLHTLILQEDRTLERQVSRFSLEGEKAGPFDVQAEAEGFVRSLRASRLKRQQKELQKQIQSAEKAERQDEVKVLLAQLNDLRSEVADITRLQQTTVRADGRSHTAWP
ncbi:MAG: DNA primase, partial [bacterium]|nr:DNA primase [bacterium]